MVFFLFTVFKRHTITIYLQIGILIRFIFLAVIIIEHVRVTAFLNLLFQLTQVQHRTAISGVGLA